MAELPDRTSNASNQLLPVSTKEKDIRNKEETHKLINGNSGEPVDRVFTRKTSSTLPFQTLILIL